MQILISHNMYESSSWHSVSVSCVGKEGPRFFRMSHSDVVALITGRQIPKLRILQNGRAAKNSAEQAFAQILLLLILLVMGVVLSFLSRTFLLGVIL